MPAKTKLCSTNSFSCFFLIGPTPKKTGQPLYDMELQEKVKHKNKKHLEELIRKSSKITGRY